MRRQLTCCNFLPRKSRAGFMSERLNGSVTTLGVFRADRQALATHASQPAERMLAKPVYQSAGRAAVGTGSVPVDHRRPPRGVADDVHPARGFGMPLLRRHMPPKRIMEAQRLNAGSGAGGNAVEAKKLAPHIKIAPDAGRCRRPALRQSAVG